MKAALELLYPRRCEGCRTSPEGDAKYICWECMASFTAVREPFCMTCGDPVEGRVDVEFLCHTCHKASPAFDCARSAYRFDGVLKDILHLYKYGQAQWLAEDLATFLHGCILGQFEQDELTLVCAVPLHRLRLRERGYNQSALLAKNLAARLGKPYRHVLRRVRSTQTHTNLTARDRVTNVVGAFEVKRAQHVKGQRVLLVDDVMTTGATASECSRALKSADASAVSVVTVARG